MKSYQVVRFGEPLVACERPTPQPAGAEVVVRVRAAGVCHSDLHIGDGGYDLGGGKSLALKLPLPLTLGHEIAGDVVATGPEATNVAAGDPVLVYPWIGCGACAVCRAGDEQLCARPEALGAFRDGGYAEFVLVKDSRYLLPLGELDPATTAPYACSGLTAYAALRKAGDSLAREPVVIIGAGGLGLMAVHLVRAMGGAGAIVVDIDERKRAAALDAGALAVVDGSAPDAAKQIAAAAGGAPRFAIDFVGSSATAQLGFASVAKGGKLVMVGLFGGAAPWALPMIPLKAVTIEGAYTGRLDELRALLDLVRTHAIPPIPVACRSLADANAALDDLRAGRLIGRAILTPA
jgi:D-arabinose 1-dehydrogenase-like Zn-dependent alcohol dehydrogenase